MDKFFYDIWENDDGQVVFQLYVETDDGDDCVEFDDELIFDTVTEAEEHQSNLPEMAYHIEQLGDV